MNTSIINLAIKEAELSTYSKFRVGAVVFKGNKIISSGHNQIRNNPLNSRYIKYRESFHAEQDALVGLDWSKCHKFSILVIRISNQNTLKMARPCPMCMSLLKFVGIKTIHYSDQFGNIVQM